MARLNFFIEDDDDEYKEIAQEILPYGVPKAVYILYHPAFVIGYDGEKKVPRWVAHRIDSKVKRGIHAFKLIISCDNSTDILHQ